MFYLIKNTVSSMRLFTVLLCVLAGSVQANEKDPDPWEGFNRSMFNFNQKVDDNVLRPAAVGYKKVVPAPGRTALSNMFSNFGEITTILNDVAQLKLLQAGADTSRFLINLTVGFFGVFDVASHIGLKKHDEDFGQTLGYWGVPSGPFVMWPLLGPSTVRDSMGTGLEYTAGVGYGNIGRNDAETLGLNTLNGLSVRAKLLDVEGMVSGDPYVFLRSFYLQRRDFLINDGQTADDFGDDSWDDDWEDDDWDDVDQDAP